MNTECCGKGKNESGATATQKVKPHHKIIEPVFDSPEFIDYMDSVPILKRISIGFFSWAGDGVPNDAHFWGKQDFLTDPQFQGDSEINYFRKTNTDLVTFLQTEGWLCLVRIRKVLRMLNDLESYEETIESLSRSAGYPVDSWGHVFEKMHPPSCRCAPCSALREVKKQLEKKNISGEEVTQSVIHHIRRCVYRVLISGIDRIFETFCNRTFSIVWFILSEEFDEHYRDTEFEKLCSLIMNDIVAIEPLTSLSNFNRTLMEIYEGATDLARAVLHKFAVILGSRKMLYTTSMNFIMFYIDSFNMIIRMLRWLESKFRVFNQLANGASDQNCEDKVDFKCVILHALNELVYSTADVMNRREAAIKVIATYQKLQRNYFGPSIRNLEKYLEFIDTTLITAGTIFQVAKLPCKWFNFMCSPTFKVPQKNVIEASLYINPYREDQFDAPQVFHCYWQDRFIIERSQTPWKILYNNKAKILLRLSVENPAEKNKKLAINVFLAEESPTAEDRIKDQYFALYESRLERIVDFFDVLKQEVMEYYSSTEEALTGCWEKPRKRRRCCRSRGCRDAVGRGCRRVNSNVNKISVPVKIKRPDRRSRYSRDTRMAILSSLMHKHRRSRKPSTIENLEQLLTFAVKTGVEGSGMLPELAGDAKDVYVSITSVDKARRAKADQEFSLHELMSFIIFWYARHGCVTEFEGHTLHRTTFGCSKTTFKESFPLLYKAAEELDAAVGEGFCVTLGPGTDGTSVLTAEAECRRVDPSQLGRKAKTMTKVPEIRNRMRKTLEERHSIEVVANSKNSISTKTPAEQTRLAMEEIRAQQRCMDEAMQESEPEVRRKDVDVDHLVELIEGTRIRANGEANPKKAAKKARQKEKKEQERQRLAEEQAKEEEKKLEEEKRKEEEEQQRLEEERKRQEAEEEQKKEEARQKQMEAAERKKEEQRQKRLEVERRKAEEKRQKKEAKKQRREQRKKDLENGEENVTEVPQQQTAQPNSSESLKKTETKKLEAEQIQKKNETAADKEKEYGRLKHEKEQRKREEEEARRLEQIQAQEKAQQNRKNKKKKKKQKQTSARQSPVEVTIVNSQPEGTPETMTPVASAAAAATASSPGGQPLADLLNGAGPDGEGKPADKNNLVTIRKHMNSTVTISMKGKEGEEDLVYTLMNGQVYPTGHDGKIFTEDAVPLQQSAFGKPETVKQVSIANVVPAPMAKEFVPGARTVPKSAPFTGMNAAPHYGCEVSSMPEIDLSQLKLPPGITITKVPQHQAGPRADVTNGIHQAEYAKPTPSGMGNYQRSTSVAGMDNRFNSNIMVVDSRCSSLESPVIGMRQSDMVYGANGTRPSSEASIASDRPSSGLDSISNNNGPSPYVGRSGYQTTDPANKRVLISMSSPYAAASRNETPSPAWQNEISGGLGGMPGMVPHIGADKHGFWNSTPNSPVAFPANSVSESYLRAQDQHFIKPRPQQRNFHAQMDKEPAPVGGYNDAAAAFGQAAPVGRRASSTPQYIQAPIAVNGTTTSSEISSLHFKSLAKSNDPHPLDQWTPWTSERFSPEEPVVNNTGSFSSTTKNSFAKLFNDDVNGRWESSPLLEKPAIRNPVNPYGPIGSNITRRSSNPTSNGIHGSFQRFSDYGRANLGGSSCT